MYPVTLESPRGGGCIVIALHLTSALEGVGGQHHSPVPIVHEAGWAPGPVWTCAKNLAPTGIGSPDRPARSQSLYGLSYPGPFSPLSLTEFVDNPTPFVPTGNNQGLIQPTPNKFKVKMFYWSGVSVKSRCIGYNSKV
jgi:hypothetical protein